MSPVPVTSAAAAAMRANYATVIYNHMYECCNHTSKLAETPILKLSSVGSNISGVLAGVFLLTLVICVGIVLKKISEMYNN